MSLFFGNVANVLYFKIEHTLYERHLMMKQLKTVNAFLSKQVPVEQSDSITLAYFRIVVILTPELKYSFKI